MSYASYVQLHFGRGTSILPSSPYLIPQKREEAEKVQHIGSRTPHTVVHADGQGTAYPPKVRALSVSALAILLLLLEKPAEGKDV